MNIMPISEWRRLTVEETPSSLPVILTADGKPIAVVGSIEDTIVMSDFEPLMKHRIRCLADLGRMGRPNDLIRTVEQLREKVNVDNT